MGEHHGRFAFVEPREIVAEPLECGRGDLGFLIMHALRRVEPDELPAGVREVIIDSRWKRARVRLPVRLGRVIVMLWFAPFSLCRRPVHRSCVALCATAQGNQENRPLRRQCVSQLRPGK